MNDALCNMAINAYNAKSQVYETMQLVYDLDSFNKLKTVLKDTHFDFKEYIDRYFKLENAYVRMRTDKIIVGYEDLEAFDLMATFFKTPICYVVDEGKLQKCLDQISCEFYGKEDLEDTMLDCLDILSTDYHGKFNKSIDSERKKHGKLFNSEHIFNAFIGLKTIKK